jgi:hypothetical protein
MLFCVVVKHLAILFETREKSYGTQPILGNVYANEALLRKLVLGLLRAAQFCTSLHKGHFKKITKSYALRKPKSLTFSANIDCRLND